MVEFFISFFRSPKPLELRVGQQEEGHVLVYTDASDSPEHSGMGIILFDTVTKEKFVAEAMVPPELLASLRKSRSAIINHLELLAILCCFLTFGDRLRGRKVLFFGDNTSSLSAIVHGYSASADLGRLSNAVHLAMHELQCDVFYAYVPTDANPADIPSRARSARSKEDDYVMSKLGLDEAESERRMVLPPLSVLEQMVSSIYIPSVQAEAGASVP